MENLLLVGAGGFGRVVLEHATKTYKCAFLDDGQDIGTMVDGVPVIGNTSELNELLVEYGSVVITIGNNILREKLYNDAIEIGYKCPNIIVPSAYVSPHATIGNGCVILNNAVVQNNAHIGNGVILNPGVEAHHDCSIGNYSLIYTNSVVRSLAKVGCRVRVGSTATICTKAVVPDGTDVPDGAVINDR